MALASKTKLNIQESRVINRSPIFYGWIIALVATIGMIGTAPGQSFTVSLFIDHYITDFGIDRTTVSTLFSLGTFTAALSLTWVGKYIDKHGNHTTGIVIAALFAVVLVAISRITGPYTLFLSFFAIRFLGQGSLWLVSSTAIARWWVRGRGWVMGLSLVGFALFRWQYQPGLQHLIDDIGWRQAWVVLGVAVGALVVPLWALFMRNQPENYGVLPDGDSLTIAKDNESGLPLVDEVNWTLSQAQHTLAFWVFLLGRVLAGAWGTGLIFHQISIFEEVGYSATTAAATYGTIGLATAFFTPLVGRYISRIRPGYVMAFQLFALIISLLLALVMTERWMLTPYIISFGLVMSLGGAFNGVVWADLFGRLYHGAIRGFVATAMVIGTSIGPIAFGFSFDYLGGYAPIIYFGIVLVLIEIVLCLVVKSPQFNPEEHIIAS